MFYFCFFPFFFFFRHNEANLKSTKHTQLSIMPSDCQLDPLQPNHHNHHHHHHHQQNNHQHHSNHNHSQQHHSLLQTTNGGASGGGGGGNTPSGIGVGIGAIIDTGTMRSTTQSHHRQSPQIMGDPPEGDDTDPDVIPNQYGKC